MDETVRIERDGGVATVLLTRPNKHNALTGQSMAQIGAAFGEIARDDAIRAVVFAGEGGVLLTVLSPAAMGGVGDACAVQIRGMIGCHGCVGGCR